MKTKTSKLIYALGAILATIAVIAVLSVASAHAGTITKAQYSQYSKDYHGAIVKLDFAFSYGYHAGYTAKDNPIAACGNYVNAEHLPPYVAKHFNVGQRTLDACLKGYTYGIIARNDEPVFTAGKIN
jgi:hypothetical protein